MARRTRRKYWKKRYSRWAPNIVKIADTKTFATGEWFYDEDLAVNPAASLNGVSQTFTVKNFEISFTLEADIGSLTQLENITAYIMYVPQGLTVGSGYYAQHPEYILAYKFIGSPSTPSITINQNQTQVKSENQQYQPITVRSRLSRRLQTGDKIILYLQGSAETGGGTIQISGLVRWWSKAN